jgi:hypothetical protein
MKLDQAVVPPAAVAFVVALVNAAAIDGLRFEGHRISGTVFWLALGAAGGVLWANRDSLRLPEGVQGAEPRLLLIGLVLALGLLGFWLVPLANIALLLLTVAVIASPLPERAPNPTEAVQVLVGVAGAFALAVPLSSVGMAMAAESVTVPADKGFVNTGLEVQANQYVVVKAEGKVHFLDGDPLAEATPDGGPNYYLGCGGPTFCGALVARIGEDGGVFALNGDGAFTANKAGPVFLGVNDHDLADNEGSYKATVEVGVPPTRAVAPSDTGVVGRSPITLPESSTPKSGDPGLPALLAALVAAAGAALGAGADGRREGREEGVEGGVVDHAGDG